MKKYGKLVHEFLDGVKMTVGTNYKSKKSIKKNDKGVLKYRGAATEIAKNYPERTKDFAELLCHTNQDVRLAVAICLVEILPHNEDEKNKAIAVVRAYKEEHADSDKIGGVSMWLSIHSEE